MKQHQLFISGPQVLIGQDWRDDIGVFIEEGKITALCPRHEWSRYQKMDHHSFPSHFKLVPGFIDLHIHGANGHDVMDGTKEALHGIAQALAGEGVTGFLATTMSASSNKLINILKNIYSIMPDTKGAAILGVHLEGPFIASEKRGAQNSMQLPSIKEMQAWIAASGDNIKIVTMAPELPQAKEMIEFLREQGIVTSIGHTNATYDEAQMAITSGCTHATHLFNAMRVLHQREPGVLGALLLADKIQAEIIVDGIHLHPAIVELVWRLKKSDNIFLVTDAMRAKCLGDGKYELGGQEVIVKHQRATLSDGTLAGSVLSMPQAIKNMQAFTKCKLAEAIMMATKNPARALGLAEVKGEIAVGKDADLVLLDEGLNVISTWRDGKIIFHEVCGERLG